MTSLSESLGAAVPFSANAGSARQDAYMRILNWEGMMTRRRGQSRLARYRQQYLYYSGENLPPGQYIQPLEINYLRVTCEAHASYLWGQWEPQGQLVTWTIRPRVGKGDQADMLAIQQWLNDLFVGHEELLYSAGLNQSIYGDCVLRPRWNPTLELVIPESILPEYFHARWSAHDIADIREVVISYPIDRQEAAEEFGTSGDRTWAVTALGYAANYAIYWEYWTTERFQIWVDNVLVREEPNPFGRDRLPGLIPFVHVPNVRTGGDFFGQGDIEAVLELQDELNRKMADNGDIISYAAHPIIQVQKYFGKVENLPVGPDAIWDMGREGEASYLTGGQPPVDIDTYLDRVLTIFQDLSYMPAAAFGRSETAQASALALAMEMMPVTQRVGWKRLQWKQSLVNYVHLAARIAEDQQVLPFRRKDMLRYRIEPNFAPILPKDRSASVLENVSLVSNGLRSIQRALEDLGERNPEQQAAEILAELKQKVAMGAMKPPGLGGKNAKGPGGSPDTGALQRDVDKG